MYRTSYELKRSKNFFCTDDCRGRWQSENLVGESNYNYSKERVKCANPNCDKFTYVKKSKIGKFKNYFCDIKCKAEYQSIICVGDKHHNFTKEIVNCSWCGKEKLVSKFELERSDNFFCNKECHGKWDSIVKVGCGSWNWNGGLLDTNCVVCSEPLKRTAWRLKNHPNSVCDLDCFAVWVKRNFSGENSPHWRGGISNGDYSEEFNLELKTIIRERDNFSCQMCGFIELENKLSVHHIDYCKTNSSFYNLIALCKSCHSKTTNENREYYSNHLSNLLKQKYQEDINYE